MFQISVLMNPNNLSSALKTKMTRQQKYFCEMNLSQSRVQMIEDTDNIYQKQVEIKPAGSLKQKYSQIIKQIRKNPKSIKAIKANNIPKFLLKVFKTGQFQNLSPEHFLRLKLFYFNLPQSKTRFDLIQLFGMSDDKVKSEQNKINRQILNRQLAENYIHVLTNKHIKNKKAYLMYCKKIMYRLDHPNLIDRIEI